MEGFYEIKGKAIYSFFIWDCFSADYNRDKNLYQRYKPDPLNSYREETEWTGLITLWDTNYVDCGRQ